MSHEDLLPTAGPLLAVPYFLESSGGLEILGVLFWIWMIYECAVREKNSTEKILWLLLVVLAPVLGSLIYFLVRVVKIRG
jgi:hypothetical protein